MNVFTDQVFIAVVVAISSTFGPVLVGWVTYHIRRKEKQEEYARQDEVARRVNEVKIDQDRANVARNLMVSKLDQIHDLVNSNMTAALQSECDALNGQLAVMYEVIGLRRANRQEPTPETLATIVTIKEKLTVLISTLEERKQAFVNPEGTG